MNAVIIDDEPLARQHIRDCLKSHPEIAVLDECSDGFSGLKSIQKHNPDLIFLDIQMPKINGFEMLELLDEIPSVIFTTAFDEYALKAFDAQAADYLLKPFSQERFDKAIGRLSLNKSHSPELGSVPGKSPEEKNRIVLKHQGEIVIIPISEILYIEAWDDYVKIHTSDQKFVKKKTLSFYEQSLEPRQFVRCHRSYLVNTVSIAAIDHSGSDSWEIRLKNGFHIPCSKNGYQKLKSTMGL